MDNSIQWISALDDANRPRLEKLQQDKAAYYSRPTVYYEDSESIQAESYWVVPAFTYHRDLAHTALQSNKVLEMGCGRAAILRHFSDLIPYYTGMDFSAVQMEKNRANYPEATFRQIEQPNEIPFADESFDMVFSVFVLEHCVFPHRFLNECMRVLKKGGILAFICPNFLGVGRMSSQQTGLSFGNGGEKLKAGKYLDALITGFDNKIKVPLHAKQARNRALAHPQFFINVQPLCLSLPIDAPCRVDADAVYLTFEPEIRNYLSEHIDWLDLSTEITDAATRHKIIYMKGMKR